MALALKIASHSETGLVRKNNQDSGYASPQLIVVADGMGGAAAGDLASALVIDAIRRIDKPTVGEEMLEALAGAIHKANDRIADLVDANGALEGMGTTVTGALFDGTQLGLAHIGDSRAYLLRDGHLQQLTHDHSWVQSLLDEGKIDPNEAAMHPHRSLLLKVLNGQPANDPDLTLVRVEAGDRLLFCSDGLCGLVDDEAIAELLRTGQPSDALACLLGEARVQGGVDNITIIVADVVEEAATASSEQVVLGAAADRSIPPANTKVRADDSEDTLITGRPASAARPSEPDDEARYNPGPRIGGAISAPWPALWLPYSSRPSRSAARTPGPERSTSLESPRTASRSIRAYPTACRGFGSPMSMRSSHLPLVTYRRTTRRRSRPTSRCRASRLLVRPSVN